MPSSTLRNGLARILAIGQRFHDAASTSRSAGRSSLSVRTAEEHANASRLHKAAASKALTPSARDHHIREARKHDRHVKASNEAMERIRARVAAREHAERRPEHKVPSAATHEEKKEEEQRQWKQGKKGGRYYIGPGGKKIYEQKRWRVRK